MTCKVVACPCMTLFGKYVHYLDHFAKFHKRNINVYRCSGCRKVFNCGKNARRHVREEKVKGSTVLIETRPNGRYIDPVGVKVPRPPSKAEAHDQTSYSAKECRRMDERYKRFTYRCYKEREFQDKCDMMRQMMEFDKYHL